MYDTRGLGELSATAARQATCPMCRAAVEWQGNPHRPFCSRKCKVADLHNWMSDRYIIPGEAVNPDAQSPATAEGESPLDADAPPGRRG